MHFGFVFGRVDDQELPRCHRRCPGPGTNKDCPNKGVT